MATTVNSSAGPTNSPDWREVLIPHLSIHYSTDVSQISQLDQNVFRVDRDNDSSWVARVFTPSHPLFVLSEHADILRYLEQQNFSSERLANSEPISTTSTGHQILITQFIEGRRPRKGEQLFPRLGYLLGRLHTMTIPATGAMTRKGGAWHHISNSGGPKEEIDAALSLLSNARSLVPENQLHLYEELRARLLQVEDLSDLPQRLTHPDLVPSNAIISSIDSSLAIVDWLGAGTGPRVASLGFLLWAAGNRSMAAVNAVVAGYSKLVSLEEGEIEKLESAILFRPLVLRCWEFCMSRTSLEEVVNGLDYMQKLVDTIAGAARQALEKNRGGVKA
ncbi:kinase-like protein [Stipitochalara longipes BDJ]|nr:kinase-like protein [Stipitochalara longipes BDJ]